jgi:hypothetical protein
MIGMEFLIIRKSIRMTDQPVEGQLVGIGIRLDPKEILIAPYEENGLTWGYTIIDKSKIPTMYIGGKWQNVVPEGVWIQMLENWDAIAKTAKDVFAEYPEYLEYPEIKELLSK